MSHLFPHAQAAGFLNKFKSFLQDLAKHKYYFQFFSPCHNPLMSGPQANTLLPLSTGQLNDIRPPDVSDYNFWSYVSIASFLWRPARRSRRNPRPQPEPPDWAPFLLTRLENRPLLRNNFSNLLDGIRDIFPLHKPQHAPDGNIFNIAMKDKSFLSSAYKHLYLREKKTPPALASRRRDGVTAPDEKEFLASFSAIKNYKHIDSHSRNHILEVLNRTIPSPALNWRMGFHDTFHVPTCLRTECNGVIADSEHVQLECRGGHLVNHLLTSFFQHHYTEFPFSSKHFQFFIPIPNMSKNLNTQLLHLLSSLSRLLFSLPHHPRFTRWSALVFFAKIRTSVASLLVLRRNARWPFKLVETFQSHIEAQLTGRHLLLIQFPKPLSGLPPCPPRVPALDVSPPLRQTTKPMTIPLGEVSLRERGQSNGDFPLPPLPSPPHPQ